MQLSNFMVDEDGIRVTSCIKGPVPLSFIVSGKGKTVSAVFPKDACSVCEFREISPVKRSKGGNFRLRYKPAAMGDLEAQAEAGRQGVQGVIQYPHSGIEATVSEAARLTGPKRVLCGGLSRVLATVSFKALAINIKRYIAAELEKATGNCLEAHLGPTPDFFTSWL